VTPPHPARRRALVLVTAGTLALAACGSSGGKVAETQDGKVTVDGKGKHASVTVKGENGGSVTYNQQKVPAGFPSAVPLPQHATLTNATSADRNGKQYFQLSYSFKGSSARAALGAYATRLGNAGFTTDTADGRMTDAAPPPLRADGQGWHVVAIAKSSSGPGTMVVTVDNA
jgi:hypothetical protein